MSMRKTFTDQCWKADLFCSVGDCLQNVGRSGSLEEKESGRGTRAEGGSPGGRKLDVGRRKLDVLGNRKFHRTEGDGCKVKPGGVEFGTCCACVQIYKSA